MKIVPTSLRIGVLRGGPSSEYDASIKSGSHILKTLGETHKPIDIFISQDGKWHIQGVERSPERILKTVDVVWNALHGEFGEDGRVQEILDHHGVPYIGSKKYSSAIAMNKYLTKEKLKNHGIKTPIHYIVRKTDDVLLKAKEIWNSVPHPLVVKPVNSNSFFGFKKVESFQDFVYTLEHVLDNFETALVEEYIQGKSVSCILVEGFRGKDLYAFPLLEKISKEELNEIENISRVVHKNLDLRNYSKSDFIVSPKRGVYFLEVNTLPKIFIDSIIDRSLEAVGSSIKEFVHHILDLALGKK